MTQVIQFGNRTITPAEIIPLLTGYQILPRLWRELVIDQAIATVEYSSEEKATAYQQFDAKHQLNIQVRQSWALRHGMTAEQLEALATRELRIEKFKQSTWGSKLESYFLNHKSQLDKVIYSVIRTRDLGVATELYFRIQAGEKSFAECAREYSQGPEAQTSGLLGPVELSMPHPALAHMLRVSHPGQIWPPSRLGEWLVIVRLEKLIPAQLDEPMRTQLLNKLFEAWLREQLNQMDFGF